MHIMFILQSQLSQSQNKVDELTKDLTMERSVNETAKVLAIYVHYVSFTVCNRLRWRI